MYNDTLLIRCIFIDSEDRMERVQYIFSRISKLELAIYS